MKVICTLILVTITSLAFAQFDPAEIDQRMDMQEKAWNRGDVEGFMEGYWRSDELRFVGKKGVTKGWDQTLVNYKKGYPTKEKMGKLHFEVQSHEVMSDTKVLTIGSWELTYPESDPVGGWFTLIWEKIEGEWYIVIDHTS